MIRVEDDFVNAIELAEPKLHEGVERKMTEKMRASKQQESERKQVKNAPELKALPKKRTSKVTLKMKESIAQAREDITNPELAARAQSKTR